MSFTKFFGERWDAPIVDDADQVPTPVGEHCYLCEREIVDGDQGFMRVGLFEQARGPEIRPVHRGCEFATTSGHLFGFCSCTAYDTYEAGVELVKRADRGTLQVKRGAASPP